MECKFLKHGVAISYDQIIKPCCSWTTNEEWAKNNHIKTQSLVTWHQSQDLIKQKQLLEQSQWPAFCKECEKIEVQGRGDSTRLGGQQAYTNYQDGDITLEIRPGNVCNFACQTCWPEASSRVSQYYHQANLINISDINSKRIDNFDFLLPVATRIKDVIILGGEPFYDKNCKNFLHWAGQNLNSNILMFTNGSQIDFDFLQNYKKKITLVFSIDAIGRPAEYIRFGTVWNNVLANYTKIKDFNNVELRVNITTSVYNYAHLGELVEWLCDSWPSLVTFGVPFEEHFLESVIPQDLRPTIIDSLCWANKKIWSSNIAEHQQHNASNALMSIVKNLEQKQWDTDQHKKLCAFIKSMDRVKRINAEDYSTFLQNLLLYAEN
jgi:hypothetical protein